MVALMLTLGLVVQILPPSETRLPQDSALAPRRLRISAPIRVPEYPAILNAPIFAPNRAPGEQAAAGSAATAANLQLIGVALSAHTASAIVRTPEGATDVLHPGESLQGWKLVAVGPDEAVFLGPSGRTTVPLDASNGAEPIAHPNPSPASETP